MHPLRKLAWAGFAALLTPLLLGCGDDGGGRIVIDRPGLVGIVDRPTVSFTAPQLTIEYIRPLFPGTFTAQILSDQPRDGDIAFDPVRGTYTLTQGASTLFFGVDSAHTNRPEYRAFLDFPLDGSTGGAIIPLDAVIVSAILTITLDFVDFAERVDVLLDLVDYSIVAGLNPADYASVPLAVLAFDIFGFDAGRDVPIDVTHLLQEAQRRSLADFQVRFLVER